jgi:type II secretory pathway pseudopilin PulG
MSRRNGFTLVEAAVAIGVVAILSGIIIPLVLKNLRDARNARARNDLHVIAGAIAAQLRDTGHRPTQAPGLLAAGAAPGPGPAVLNPDGTANRIWVSAGMVPNEVAPGAVAGAPAGPAVLLAAPAGNTFENLFESQDAVGNQLFNLRGGADEEFKYKGPYLTADQARKTDPWGRAYIILGYNANGQANDGPIWVVSAGEGGTIAAGNVTPNGGRYPATWDYGLAGSRKNLAVRVH